MASILWQIYLWNEYHAECQRCRQPDQGSDQGVVGVSLPQKEGYWGTDERQNQDIVHTNS